jgi:cytochrome P450/NADPH-cytochrome P450 reductase
MLTGSHDETMSVPIPQPPIIPFLGNVTSVEREIPLCSFQPLAKIYGEVYQLKLLGGCF